MVKGLLRKFREAGSIDRDEGASPAYTLDIEIDESAGVLRIYDPRAFHAGRRGFCRRLVEAAAANPGFRAGEIDLAAASCRLAFDRRSATDRTMAEAVIAAIRQAAEGPSGDDRPHWWRRPSRWSTLTTYRTPDGVSSWETLEAHPGRIRLRHEALLGDCCQLDRVKEALVALDGIEACRVSPWSRTLTLEYRPETAIARRLLDAVEHALRGTKSARPETRELAESSRGDDAGVIAVVSGYRRLKYLALAGGSFAMSVIGLILPGIPTVPFLLATSYYLARSSPKLNDRLRRTVLFGPILVEWEQYSGLSRSSKANLIGLTTAIVVVSLAMAAASPVVFVVILIIGSLSLVGIARLPGLPHEAARSLGPVRTARLALPAT